MRSKLRKLIWSICLMLLVGAAVIGMPEPVKAENIKMQCGNNVYATLDDLGTMTISGTGDMWADDESSSNIYFYEHYDHINIKDKIYKLVVEQGVTSLGDWAFASAGNLQSVSISHSVKSIGEGTFYYCDGLHSINIPGNVQTIGKSAFASSALKNCQLNVGLKTIGEYSFSSTPMTSIIIPEGVLSIESLAFYDSSVTYVSIPKNITIIKNGAFGKVNATIYSMDVTIGEGAFARGSQLTAERNSTADVYAQNHSEVSIKYFQHEKILNFDANGGTVDTPKKTVLTETYCGTLPTPRRKGYTFVGWFTARNGGQQMTATTTITQKNAITLYARWQKVSVGKGKKPSVKSSKAGQIIVKYGAVSRASGYQIQYSRKANMKSAKTISLTSRSKTIKKLKKGQSYYVRVRAYKYDSTGKKIYGKWSEKKKIKVRK